MGGLKRAVGTAAGLTAALAAWAVLVEPRRLVVRREELTLPRWPAALDGLRVALVSDLHAGGPHARLRDLRRIAARTARERPDLVLLLGDFVDPDLLGAAALDPDEVIAALRPLAAAPLGRAAVLGNHDWLENGPRVRYALEKEGVLVLENRAARVGDGARSLWLVGLDDLRERDPNGAAPAEVPDGAPALALLHDPDLFDWIPPSVSLTVAGHTHGGQVRVPGLRARMIPSRAGARYARGLVEEDGRLLYVTAGTGEAGLPVRFLVPPEVVLLTLRSGGNG